MVLCERLQPFRWVHAPPQKQHRPGGGPGRRRIRQRDWWWWEWTPRRLVVTSGGKAPSWRQTENARPALLVGGARVPRTRSLHSPPKVPRRAFAQHGVDPVFGSVPTVLGRGLSVTRGVETGASLRREAIPFADPRAGEGPAPKTITCLSAPSTAGESSGEGPNPWRRVPSHTAGQTSRQTGPANRADGTAYAVRPHPTRPSWRPNSSDD
jgi:hypothetical protein